MDKSSDNPGDSFKLTYLKLPNPLKGFHIFKLHVHGRIVNDRVVSLKKRSRIHYHGRSQFDCTLPRSRPSTDHQLWRNLFNHFIDQKHAAMLVTGFIQPTNGGGMEE